MKIEGPNPLRQPHNSGKAGRQNGGNGFAETLAGLGGEPRQSGAAGPSAPAGSLSALLAVQAYDDPGERRRQAAARGLDLLDELEELRRHLLTGAVPRATLERLSALTSQSRAEIDDPRLSALLDEIDLRAQVELAKLGALPENSPGG